MLLQSQDYVLSPLTAMPAAWSSDQASRFEVLPKVGGTLQFRYPSIAKAVVKTAKGESVDFAVKGADQISFETSKGHIYVMPEILAHTPVAEPSSLTIDQDVGSHTQLSWTASADAKSYNLYRAVSNAPDYELIASGITDSSYVYKVSEQKQMTLKVTAVRADGREGAKGATIVRLLS